MTHCPDCGANLVPGVPFCNGCGRALATSPAPTPGGPTAGWLPPTLSAPVHAATAPVDPDDHDADAAQHPRRERRRVRLVAASAAGIGVAALAAVLWLWAGGAEKAGGASSPSQAVTGLVDALNNEDPVAAIGYLAPDEVDGMVELIEAIQSQATDQGMPGLTKGEGLDVSIALSDLEEDSPAPNVSVVSADVGLDLSNTGVAGPIDGMLGARRHVDVSLDVVTVKIDGGWYVSPMLTVGTFLADVEGLPKGDFTEVAASSSSTTASSATDAVEMMAVAAVEQDYDTLQAVVGAGEARFVRVFSRAIAELLDRGSFAARRAEARANNDGEGVVLSSLDFRIPRDGVEEDVSYDDACIGWHSSQLCLFDTAPGQLTGLSAGDLSWSVVEEGGTYRVAVISSLATVARHAVANMQRPAVLRALNLEMLDEARNIEPDADVQVDIDALGYALFQFRAVADTTYTSTVDGGSGNCWVEGYSLDDSGEWTYDWLESGQAREARLLVECDTDSQLTVRVNTVRIEQVALPLDTQGSLRRGQTMVYEFGVAQEGFFELSATGPVSVQLESYMRVTDDGFFQLAAGMNRVYVSADGEGGSFSLSFAPYATPRGFDGGFSRATLSLEYGGDSVRFFAFAGDVVTIDADPSAGQDIMLAAVCCSDKWVDPGYPGDTESTTVTVIYTGWQEVHVAAWGYRDAYGTAEVRISFR